MPKTSQRLIRYTLIQGKPYAWVLVAGRLRLVPVQDPVPGHGE